MGQHQLLIIVLMVVILGIAFTVGFTIFRDQASASNRDSITNDLVNFAASAQAYYRRPTTLGGGGRSFDGFALQKITSKPTNPDGSYSVVGAPRGNGPLILRGVGTELGNDGVTKVKVDLFVYPDSIIVDQSTIN
jgi:hypothetical protein